MGGWWSNSGGSSTGSSSGSSGGWWGGSSTSSKNSGKHHGLLGSIVHEAGHLVAQTGKDLEGAAVGLGPGIYQIGKATGQQIIHGEGSPFHHRGDNPYPLLDLTAAVGKQTAADLRHPLRHPGNTLLDVLPAANAVAKTGEAGAIVARTGKVGEGVKALGKTKPEPRFVTAPNGAKVEAGVYSRSASGRVVQKALDKLREKHPESRIVAKRIGKQRFQNERVNAHVANFDNAALLAKAKGLNKAQQLAIRVVAEQVPLSTRIADAKRLAAETDNPTVRKMLNNHATLLERAGHYVTDVNGAPKFKADQARLRDVYQHAKRVANKREKDLIESGQLKLETAAGRKAAVAQHFDAGLVHEIPGSDFFISYRHARAPKTLGGAPQVGVRSQVGVPKRLEELSHKFEGEAIRTGNVNPKTVEQVAEDSQRANKFLAVWRQRGELGKLAVDYKASDNHIPVRPIWLKNKKWPVEIRHAIQGLTENLTPEDELSRVEKLRQFMFPEMSASVGTRVKGIKWIDRRYVGDLNLPRTLGAGEKIARVGDRVNGPFRALTLFRPGYVPPNLANNIFLNVIHGSTHHLVQASRLATRLGPEETAMIDTLMGEGKTVAAGRPLHDVGQRIQRGLSKTVDVIPRRAAWLHEANRFGYKTPAEIKTLLHDESKAADLRRVTREANGEMIDYGNLGPAEQALVRRLLFLYPWVKGATVYGGRFLREHPVKAGLVGQVGQQGEQYVQNTFGTLPSYARGLVPAGGMTVNTEPFNNLPQATTSLQTIIGLLSNPKGVETQNRVIEQLAPVLQSVLSQDKSAQGNLLGASLVRLAQEAVSPDKSDRKVYPQSRQDALLRFLLGSAAPRRLNLSSAQNSAALEQSGR